MCSIVAVGVPRGPAGGDWDFWLPFCIVLSLAIFRFVVRARITVWTAGAAFVSGTLLSWSIGELGVLVSVAAVTLATSALASIARRIPRPHTGMD